MQIDRKFTFKNFIEYKGNRIARHVGLMITERLGQMYNPFYIFSKSGMGKTHLLHAIGNEIMDKFPSMRIKYITGSEFMREFIESAKGSKMSDFRSEYRDKCDVFLLDDIHDLDDDNREGTRDELFETISYLLNTRRQVIITSDRAPANLTKFEERLRSRFQWGMVANIEPPTFEARVAILKAKAEEMGKKVGDDVVYLIAERVMESIRHIEGVLKTLITISEVEGKAVNMELAERVLKTFNFTQKTVDTKKIIDEVAKFFNLKPENIKSPKRHKTISQARQIAIYLSKELLNLSTIQLGKEFGGRDHSTIIYSLEKIKDELSANEELRKIVDEIRMKIIGISSEEQELIRKTR